MALSTTLKLSRKPQRDSIDPDNLGMHTTQTIDYGFVLFGTITLELDEGTRELSAYDVIVQRATPNA